MEFYVGTLTHNCCFYTQQTLGSFKTKYPHNFIIVDNGSTDGTLKMLAALSHFPNQIHIKNHDNRGVAAGWNQILRRALDDPEFRYIYLINNDLILRRSSCDLLLEFLHAHPEYIAVSSIESNRFKPQPGYVNDKALSFVAVMFTRKCIELIGFFDEQFYPAYFEDNDYMERIRREAWPKGFKTGVVHDSIIVHVGSRTIREGGVCLGSAFDQNRQRFRQKWGFIPHEASSLKEYLNTLSRSEAGEDMFREVPILYAETLRLNAKKIIDLGVRTGLSTRAFLIASFETDGHVWSVDVTDCPFARETINKWKLSDRWTFTVMNDLEYVKTWREGQVDIVMIDTSHYYEHTLKELEAYSPLVRPGGVIFLHDTIPAHQPIQVSEAITEFLKCHQNEYDYYNFQTVHGLGRLTKKPFLQDLQTLQGLRPQLVSGLSHVSLASQR